jgi:ubiquinone/menaquinone biosynthesis C-methylase UbiE
VFKTLKKIIGKRQLFSSLPIRGSEEAYDLWSEDYDAQPGNLMLDLDEEVFSVLLAGLSLKDKRVADIGCGTGRHWPKIFACKPLALTGFDVSSGMLIRLQEKFPLSYTKKITDNKFSDLDGAMYDVLISTLTVAHIENLEEALVAWCRILKEDGDIIITDFHPDALANGGKRTFQHHNKQIEVQNFVHHVEEIERLLLKYNFHVVNRIEKIVDESVKHYYVAKNALPVYEKFKDSNIIYGLHLKRRVA